jgi:PPOX class probable F420-dependent enzyme
MNSELIVPEAFRDLLERPICATVMTINPDGSPHASVVWRLWEKPYIYFVTDPKSRKGINIARDPRVALTMIDPEYTNRYLTVYGNIEYNWPDPIGEFSDRIAILYQGKPDYSGNVPEELKDRLYGYRVKPVRFVGKKY